MNTKRLTPLLLLLTTCITAAAGSVERPAGESGQVQLPLDVYTALVARASDPSQPAPAGHALGNAGVTVRVEAIEGLASAAVQVALGIDVLEDEWALIPVLPAGTPVESALVGGQPVRLLATPQGLAWSTRQAGSYTMTLRYRVDASRSEGGYTLSVPLPEAAAITLSATLPGAGLDASVIPAAGTSLTAAGDTTRVSATIPTTRGVQISWRTPAERGHTISRAVYRGELSGSSVQWTGRLVVERFGPGAVRLPLLPRSATLVDLRVDGEEATILVEEDRFATLVEGEGLHEVVIVFQTPVLEQEGPPRTELLVPQIPVSRFELSLPGKKDLTVTPAANVTTRVDDERTVAVVHVPMTERVSFAWSEAVPEDLRTELRSNAAAYHTVHAEEGVLYVRALVDYEITRGESNVIDVLLPAGVQINRVTSESGVVADWRIGGPGEDGRRVVSVFLDRQLRGTLRFEVHFDRSLGGEEEAAEIAIPLLELSDAQRQKGMVALLSSAELTLNPLDASGATKVGENQLPPFIRDAVEMTVAHTYKYTESPPRLLVQAATPERAQGKFDARVDTLISLGDVTLTGSATVQVHVKSGRIMELRLALPSETSLLSLTAPSLRTHRVREEPEGEIVDIEFTQEMEGLFAVDLTYERILADGDLRFDVPTVTVREAQVEQGRIAVEALSAVEVQPAVTEQLTALDVNELPQQLLLRTTNPILLAYKYVHADPPCRLALEVKRHEVLGVQEAAIDRAHYRTLFTSDGLRVTTADLTLRNSRKQFLRLRLPGSSEVWSVFVDGKPEKPALAEDRREVLVKIINSTRPFDVRVVYATPGERIGWLGAIEAALPDLDILATRSRWDLFVPEGLVYGDPATNMEVLEGQGRISREALKAELEGRADRSAAPRAIQPLRISVPAAGVHFAFEKLYANQRDQRAWVELPYASSGGAVAGQSIGVLGALLFWTGLALYLRQGGRARRLLALALSALGATVAVVVTALYGVGPTPLLLVSLLALLVAGWIHGRRLLAARRPLPGAGEPA